MMKKKCGKIINMASVVGLHGNAGQANYAASKGGVIAMTKSLAKELALRNITVNAIAPGFIETDMTNVLSDNVKEAILNSIPLHTRGRSFSNSSCWTVFPHLLRLLLKTSRYTRIWHIRCPYSSRLLLRIRPSFPENIRRALSTR